MVILFSIKFIAAGEYLNKLPGIHFPFMVGQVGAVRAALWPAIRAPNNSCRKINPIVTSVKVRNGLLKNFCLKGTDNRRPNQNAYEINPRARIKCIASLVGLT